MSGKSNAIKVCNVIAPADKKKECMEIMGEMLTLKDKNELGDKINALVHDLSNITGRSLNEIVDTINKHCPVCGKE
jgi:transketolase N-terminal domain/subunit